MISFFLFSFFLSIAAADPMGIYGFGGRNMGMGMGGMGVRGQPEIWIPPFCSQINTFHVFALAFALAFSKILCENKVNIQ